ncbi:tellurite resistance/C4-dicarboxylate transporter family protein [Streptomyces sp. ME19-01-6]|uniref:tellurite resistance/C4-dicarboxylate transporter family protein n=1 Tax=Streptomyces sp. ME19-01-6 TaxID=3028686 RepID=UPI0029AAFB39|nr:tellurite resistance/C4-dicarboxylate transporter family protein [Streptomyces sp. ME19-01-6]MDX3230915.1 tellurite resistance/C4-dicarboxylate transporter family protein [Streptomyces sp. ME19-01-6]
MWMKCVRMDRELPPGGFAPVMATGIVSQGVGAAGARWMSDGLLAVALALYGLLLAAWARRVTRHRHEVAAQLRDPAKVFGFFTFVAGSDVLATRLAAGPWRPVAAILLAVALPVWPALMWCAARVVRGLGPGGVLRHVDGSWFLCVVGLQSLVLAGAALEPHRALAAKAAGWALGVALYAVVAVAVAGRLVRLGVRPRELSPPYWVTMGACAISLLAGARLVPQGLDDSPHGGVVAKFLLVMWGWATFLLPVLLAAGVWRHGVRRVPAAYEPTWWTIVFPLGMYAVSTAALGGVEGPRRLVAVGHAMAWAASGAWALVALGAVCGRGIGQKNQKKRSRDGKVRRPAPRGR